MAYNFLLEILKTTLQKNKIEKLASIASEEAFSVQELINLTFHQDEQIGFRAAWILENIYTLYPERFLPAAECFLIRFPQQNNLSARRHYSKILALMTGRRASPELKKALADYDTAILVEVVFSWLIDTKVPVAVKSHCLNILANLTERHSWIKEELIQTMGFLVDKQSIAFYAKVKQIRKQLRIFSI
ncbi:hypothetical protein [Pedobacter lusitanus]|uniref:hypothetical protein n=1 Tax=Pedobacter lusitanus TaxID=1503925 RepID=UPI000697ADF1|nr:hypothetical protein [Pedobacter lusitanus]